MLPYIFTYTILDFYILHPSHFQSQWWYGLRRRSVATHLLRLWVRIPPGAWMSVSFKCCVSSDRGLCDELITCPEESYWLWCVILCVIYKPHEWGSPGPLGAVVPNTNTHHISLKVINRSPNMLLNNWQVILSITEVVLIVFKSYLLC
jgi:hypothetical protein